MGTWGGAGLDHPLYEEDAASMRGVVAMFAKLQAAAAAAGGAGDERAALAGLQARLGRFWTRFGIAYEYWWEALDDGERRAALRAASPYLPLRRGDTTVAGADGAVEDVGDAAALAPELNVADLVAPRAVDADGDGDDLLSVFGRRHAAACLSAALADAGRPLGAALDGDDGGGEPPGEPLDRRLHFYGLLNVLADQWLVGVLAPSGAPPPEGNTGCAACGAAEAQGGGGGPLLACAGCKWARYCGPGCQALDWREGGHKAFCRARRRARAGGG